MSRSDEQPTPIGTGILFCAAFQFFGFARFRPLDNPQPPGCTAVRRLGPLYTDPREMSPSGRARA